VRRRTPVLAALLLALSLLLLPACSDDPRSPSDEPTQDDDDTDLDPQDETDGGGDASNG
jgi:outer membrane biogenesis lipoprotein LolB